MQPASQTSIPCEILPVRVTLFCGAAKVREDKATQRFSISVEIGEFHRSFYWAKLESKIRLVLISLQHSPELSGKPLDSRRVFSDEEVYSAMSQGRIAEVLPVLHRIAADNGEILRACTFELRAEEKAGEIPGLAHAVSAGLPAPILLREGEISFPLRAGIPGGIVAEWVSQTQTMEWHPGDVLYFYTDTGNDKLHPDFREYIKSSGSGPLTLPEDMILLRVEFLA
ncbi:MAG: SpoIIE family protein phosphatase [Leptospirales bacterium]|nr:SpoIIE family protein phosphatase [Leptospirales bacterium]